MITEGKKPGQIEKKKGRMRKERRGACWDP